MTTDRNPYGLGLNSVKKRRGAWREGIANVEYTRTGLHEDDVDRYGHIEDESEWQNSIARRQRVNEEGFTSEEVDSSEDEGDMPIDATLQDSPDGDVDEEAEDDETEDQVSQASSHDPNDIIDIIPSPSTAVGHRQRTISQSRSLRSRKSFYARQSQEHSPEDGLLSSNTTALPTGGKYGTFRSLAGI